MFSDIQILLPNPFLSLTPQLTPYLLFHCVNCVLFLTACIITHHMSCRPFRWGTCSRSRQSSPHISRHPHTGWDCSRWCWPHTHRLAYLPTHLTHLRHTRVWTEAVDLDFTLLVLCTCQHAFHTSPYVFVHILLTPPPVYLSTHLSHLVLCMSTYLSYLALCICQYTVLPSKTDCRIRVITAKVMLSLRTSLCMPVAARTDKQRDKQK